MYIRPESVEEIKSAADIVDVISQFVPLKKSGSSLKGLCPFHNEKTPSFFVSPTKNTYHCFGCGEHGDSVGFLIKAQSLSYPESLLYLAERSQIQVKFEQQEGDHQTFKEYQKQKEEKELLLEILASAARFFAHNLPSVQSYLSERQITVTEQFGLGYAPTGWQNLHDYLVQGMRYPANLVEKVGLIKKRENGSGYYDLFRNRLMIPIRDQQGRVIAFGGRSLDGSEPKYLNSPESPVFDKSLILYGYDQAIASIRKQNQVYVVEGYFDVIKLHQVGITNTVGVMGTTLSSKNLYQLAKSAEEIILLFDNDQAGINAIDRVFREQNKFICSGQINLTVFQLPKRVKDPDSFFDGTREVADFKAMPTENILTWRLDQIFKDQDITKPFAYHKVFGEAEKFLLDLTQGSSSLYDFYLDQCASRLSNGDRSKYNFIYSRLEHQTKRLSKPISKEKQPLEIKGNKFDLVLAIAYHYPTYRQQFEALITDNQITLLPELLSLWHRLDRPDEQLIGLVNSVVIPEGIIDEVFKEGCLSLKINSLERRQQQILDRIKLAVDAAEKVNLLKDLQAIARQIQELKVRKN